MGSIWTPNSAFKPLSFLNLHHHLQTIVPAFIRKGFSDSELSQVPLRTLELEDGDFLEYRDFFPDVSITPKNWVLLCHGFEGTWDAGYLKQATLFLRSRGVGVRVWMYRSCGHQPNRLARFYHSGATDDLAAMHQSLALAYPDAELSMIGFSLGGNLVTRYGAQMSQGLFPTNSLKKIVSISAPLDLAASSALIGDTAWGLYCQIFLPSLYRKVAFKLEKGLLDAKYAIGLKAKTVWQFDDWVTAPLHGFRSAQDYYDTVAGIHCLGQVQVSLFILAAKDDMLISQSSMPDVSSYHPMVQSFYAPKGGHLGFLGYPKDWMMETVYEWLFT